MSTFDLRLTPENQAFLENLSASMLADDASRQRAALHQLIDQMDMETQVIIAVRKPGDAVVFETFGSMGPEDAVYMIEGVKQRLYLNEVQQDS